MGIFTWSDCTVKKPFDKNGRIKCDAVVEYGGYAKLICPDNTELETDYHGSDGVIRGRDIYELVAEWNRTYITSESITEKPDDPTKFYGLYDYEKRKLRDEGKSEDEITAIDDSERMKHFYAAVERWKETVAMIDEYRAGASDEVLEEKYGADFKREIGIAISCDDDNASRLKYPVKLTKDKNAHGYENLFISYSCQ